jgi:integrase
VPLSADLVQRLRVRRDALDGKVVRLPGTHDDRLVFPASDGKPQLYHNWYHRKWQPLCKRASVTGHPHQLRHAFATMLIQAGESAATVSELIGHANGAFTMKVYADSWPAAVAAAGEKVHGLLFAESGSSLVANPPSDGQLLEFSGGAGADQQHAHQLPLSST